MNWYALIGFFLLSTGTAFWLGRSIRKVQGPRDPEYRPMTDPGSLPLMTPEQIEAQRRSFAFGNVSMSNPNVTRELVDRVADEMKERG